MECIYLSIIGNLKLTVKFTDKEYNKYIQITKNVMIKPTGNVTAFKSETGPYVEESTDWRTKVNILFLNKLYQCFNFVLFLIQFINLVSNMF